MRRTAIWLALLLTLSASASVPLATRSRAQSSEELLGLINNKFSADILLKLDEGDEEEQVRVIVHPRAGWSGDLDQALSLNGASDVRQFQNFDYKVVSLPAGGAANLALRSDVAYVSINKELRTLGHVSATTGADSVRTTAGTNA